MFVSLRFCRACASERYLVEREAKWLAVLSSRYIDERQKLWTRFCSWKVSVEAVVVKGARCVSLSSWILLREALDRQESSKCGSKQHWV